MSGVAAGARSEARNLTLGANEALERAGQARFYVVLSHVAKKQNVGMMMRSASAFGVREILVAGSRKNTQFFGAQGTHKHVPVSYFESIELAVEYARGQGCQVCGIEIKPEARSLLDSPFAERRHTAFMLGNEGEGLSEKQCKLCDYFLYIPHYGDGTASLNVSVAASIVFQHFAAAQAYPERAREGEKFVVKQLPPKSGAEGELDMQLQEERRAKREAAAAAAAESLDGASGGLFGAAGEEDK